VTAPGPIIQVRGSRQLRATLRRAGDDLESMKSVHAQVAGMVTGAAVSSTPARSGRLRGSVRPGVTKTSALVRAGGAAVPYARPIHWGWPRRNIRASLFLTDPAKRSEPAWVAVYTREVNRILDRIEGTNG